ncbi:uncharacterized protein [Hetaerina americana]|uniref:uncharacterized protein n=1 Tax=Hetaerina americana TaxID=62018 RepID=UPI003A7F44A9
MIATTELRNEGQFLNFPEGNLTASESITFDISGLESTEVMIEAELHLYREKTPAPLWNVVDYSNETILYYLDHAKKADRLRNGRFLPSRLRVGVRVYQRLSASPSFPLDSHRLLGVQHVGPDASPAGWHVVNVRAAVADWLTRRRPNLGFLVHVASSTGRTAGDRVRFARRGIVHGKEPALVIFTRRNDLLGQEVARQSAAGVIRRRWRSVVDGVANGTRWAEWHRASPEAPVQSPREHDGCRLKDLWVDLRKVGLAKWIAAPR